MVKRKKQKSAAEFGRLKSKRLLLIVCTLTIAFLIVVALVVLRHQAEDTGGEDISFESYSTAQFISKATVQQITSVQSTNDTVAFELSGGTGALKGEGRSLGGANYGLKLQKLTLKKLGENKYELLADIYKDAGSTDALGGDRNILLTVRVTGHLPEGDYTLKATTRGEHVLSILSLSGPSKTITRLDPITSTAHFQVSKPLP